MRETRTPDGYDYPLRRVMHVIECTIDKRGQRLLVPEIEIEGWWTSLWFDAERIIALYADLGTSEQFHSEFKTDLDIERLPSCPAEKLGEGLVVLWGRATLNLHRSAPTISIHAPLPEAHERSAIEI